MGDLSALVETALARVRPSTDDPDSRRCRCEPSTREGRLVVDADDCPGGGDLAASPACRASVIRALEREGTTPVCVRRRGLSRTYVGPAADLLDAAGAFAGMVRPHDEWLADRACRDPLGSGEDAVARAAPVADLAKRSGLLAAAKGYDEYERALEPLVGPKVADARIRRLPPADARLLDRRTLETDCVVRRFETADERLDLYHLTPLGCRFDIEDLETLERARSLLADSPLEGRSRAKRAVDRVADGDAPIAALAQVLEKHTADLGVLVDCFADPAVSDVFATAPVADTPLRVRIDGELARTNAWLTERGARALASRLRLDSGRAFSRAAPTLDAATTAGDRQVRVAATRPPVSAGFSYTLRAHDEEPWRLADLVDNGTLTPAAAALLSVTVERAGAVLIAGTRGAGKTTLLGALLFALPRSVRTLVIEDTPELPVDALQEQGQDVQALLTESGEGPGIPPEKALRTALRLGEGALVLGEVRGEEAAVLYEAMRVGASGSAVLGTIHGDGPNAVRERVVEDLGVPATSFATTDLVVTLAPVRVDGQRLRRVVDVSEVIVGEDDVRFGPLFERTEAGLAPVGRIDRGNSHLVEALLAPDERYADLREELAAVRDRFAQRPGIAGVSPAEGQVWAG